MHKINSLNHSLLAYTQEFLRWLFLHNLSNFSLTSLRTTCFLSNRPLVFVHVSRCLIYKVHRCHLNHRFSVTACIWYHAFPSLSSAFLSFFAFIFSIPDIGRLLAQFYKICSQNFPLALFPHCSYTVDRKEGWKMYDRITSRLIVWLMFLATIAAYT